MKDPAEQVTNSLAGMIRYYLSTGVPRDRVIDRVANQLYAFGDLRAVADAAAYAIVAYAETLGGDDDDTSAAA